MNERTLSPDAASVKLWLEAEVELGVTTVVDIVSFQSQWTANAIPKAVVQVALGRRTTDGLISPIHSMIDWLKKRRKVKIIADIRSIGLNGFQGNNYWPNRPFVIFEGYTVLSGYNYGEGATFTLELEHWVAALTYSSAISALSVPSNPAQFTFQSVIGLNPDSATGVKNSGHMTGNTRAAQFISTDTVESDFWGDGVKPFLISLTQEDSLVTTEASQLLGLADEIPPDSLSEAALKRFEPLETEGGYKFGQPTDMNLSEYEGDIQNVVDQIALTMGYEFFETLAGTTIWDKVIQYSSSFMMAVIPLIDRCLVVPFIPGLRSHYLEISASEYLPFSINRESVRDLRGVAIYGSRNVELGITQGELTGLTANTDVIGGYFQGNDSGQILFQQAPLWLATVNLSSAVRETSGAAGNPVPDCLDPVVESDTAGTTDSRFSDNLTLMRKYAQAVYSYEQLKGRTARLQGKLRFDISPGSNIKIETIGDKFIKGQDELAGSLYATVIAVRVSISVTDGQASTGFDLAYVRTEVENDQDSHSIDAHPIWNTPWLGAPLVQLTPGKVINENRPLRDR